MTGEKNMLSEYQIHSETQKPSVTMPDGTVVYGHGQETVQWKQDLGAIHIKNVMYITEFERSHISVKQMTQKEYKVIFSGKGIAVKTDELTMANHSHIPVKA